MLFGTQRIDEQGHLHVGGVSTVELAQRFGTPLYVIDEEGFRRRCREYLDAFRKEAPEGFVSFATKAFLCKAAARLAAAEGMHIDVASMGELKTVLEAGVCSDDITFHGNYKKDEDIIAGLEAAVGLFAMDSFDEMYRLSELAVERGIRQRAVLRVAPGIDAHTLDAISTGRSDTKFGITVETGAALQAIEECRGLPGVELVGLHAHVGSQICSLDPFRLLGEKMVDFASDVHGRTGWLPELLILGGGLGVHYTPEDDPPTPAGLAAAMVGSIRERATQRGFPVPRLGIEPGRSIAAEVGLTLYTIGPIKDVPGEGRTTRKYVVVDGGLSDNPRPLMYGSRYPALLAARANAAPEATVRLAGRHCETDTLFDVDLPAPRSGEVLALLTTGAYNHTMASNYNSFYRPAVVFVADGEARVVVRRETIEDILQRDVG